MTYSNKADVLKRLKAYLPAHLSRDISNQGIAGDALLTASIHLTSLRFTLSTYLPAYLVKLVTEDPRPGLVSGSFRYGTAMFADVSGFTAMSEKLSALGKEGAEEVTGIVNDYFDTMLEISARYNGDLLKFGGDALLIFFEGEYGPHRAVTTAHAMQSAMSRFAQVETSQGAFPLRMSIGAGTGPIFLANLGFEEQMEYAVMGRALANMAQAEDRAVAGQIIVDRATRDAANTRAAFKPAGDDFWLLDSISAEATPAEDFAHELEMPLLMMEDDQTALLAQCEKQVTILDGLRPFIPQELMRQLIADPQRQTVPGSHRPVTVMFANFYGIDEIIEALGPEHEDAITRILNEHFVTMSRILDRYAGVVNKVDTYAIGHRIMALFGALRAREDDPQRAVRAALEMNQALAEVNKRTRQILKAIPGLKLDFGEAPLKQRIGLNTGFVFAGNVGSSARREYSVMGDEVNLTARLMGVAKEGEVLISQSVVRHVKHEFTLTEKEPVRVKGKTAPVRNFVVTGEKERQGRWANVGIADSPIVGRADEIRRGKATVDRIQVGDGAILIISGSSGIGKTRLAEAVVAYGKEKGMGVLAGTCLSYGQTMPYHPWIEVLRGYFGFQPHDDAQSRAEMVNVDLARIGEAEAAPIIGEMLRLPIPDNELTAALDARLRRQRLLDLTLSMIQRRAQRQPLILILEDAHWADPASMDLINYVSRNIQGYPILVILLHRPDDTLPNWAQYDHAIDLPIGDLPNSALLEIVRGMMGPIDLPDSLRDLILQKGAGNPFFTEEVVRALIDGGALQQDESGEWQVVQNMDSVELPDTIHGIIISRIDRLLETDRRILQVASVVGATFSSTVVDGVYPYGDLEDPVRVHLDYLDGLGLTEYEAAQVRANLHRFKHLTTREVVYESQAFGQRRSLHSRIADYIERTAESVAEEVDLLAYHFFEGQMWTKALEFNLLAARRAQKEYANDAAVLAYRRTLEAAAKLPEDTLVEEVIAHEALGDIFTVLGQYDEALAHFNQVRAFIQAEPDSIDRTRHLAELCRKFAWVYENRGEYEAAFEQLRRGLQYVQDDGPSVEAARLYLLGSGLYQRQGNYESAIEWCHESLAVARQIPTRAGRETEAQIYYNLGGVAVRQGDLKRAINFCQEAIQIYEQIEDVVRLSQAYINLANAYSDQGDWRKASEYLDKSLVIKRKIGDIPHQGIILNNLAMIHMHRGDWTQAGDMFAQSRAIWQQVGATAFEAVTLSNLGQVHIYRQDWDNARHCLERSQSIFSEIGSEDFLPELERRWSEFYLHTGKPDQALPHIEHSIELADKLKARLEEGMSYRILGEIRLKQGQFLQAKDALHKSLNMLQDLDSEYEAAKTILALVQLSLVQLSIGEGALPETLAQLQQAVGIFKKLGARIDLEKALRFQSQLSEPAK